LREKFGSINKIYIQEKRIEIMTKKYTVLIEKDEEGWLISEVMELPGCHTQAKTMDQLLERTKEAIQAYIDTSEEKDISEFVGIQQIEV
jgi:predicted RNase H-like HicB family nuclease